MTKTKSLILCSLFAALITAGAYIKIPTPVITLTMQTMFVMLAGLLLGAKRGSIAAFIYLVLGLSGIPVFTKGGGLWYVLEPSFGYIVGFVAAAFVMGKLSGKNSSYLKILFSCFAGIFIIYLFGALHYYIIVGLYLSKSVDLLKLILIPLPGDIISAFIAAFIAYKKFLHYYL